VIEANLITPLVNLLQNAEFDIKKEAAWAISNATSGGSHEQIKYGEAPFFNILLEVNMISWFYFLQDMNYFFPGLQVPSKSRVY